MLCGGIGTFEMTCIDGAEGQSVVHIVVSVLFRSCYEPHQNGNSLFALGLRGK